MNVEYLRTIESINIKALPASIQKAYKAIEFGWETDSAEIKYNFSVLDDLYADVSFVLKSKRLEKIISFNRNITTAIESYKEGFDEGFYDNVIVGIDDLENQIFTVFSGVYERLPSILNPLILQFKKNVQAYNSLNFLEIQLMDYGQEVGRYWQCWKIILNNVTLFQPIFDKHLKQSSIESESYDNRHFNLKAHRLYNYLVAKYRSDENTRPIKHLNIFYYLKDLAIVDDSYRFTFTQEKYKIFVELLYGFTIKKFEKHEHKFKEVEVPLLKDLTSDFEI